MATNQKTEKRGAVWLLVIVAALAMIIAPSYMIWILENRIKVNLALLAVVGFVIFVAGIVALYKATGGPTAEED